MPELSTGLVIAGAYADKLRRTLFAQLREQMRQGVITGQEIARAAAEINRLLYGIIVEALRLDKGDVVRIRVSYEVSGGAIMWRLDTLRIEAFRRIPDDEVMRIVRDKLGEAEQAGEERAEPIRAEARSPEETGPSRPVAEASYLGETIDGAQLFLLKNGEGENIGLAMIEDRAGAPVLDAVIVPGGGAKPYRIYAKLENTAEKLRNNPAALVDIIGRSEAAEIDEEEARQLIQERMKKLL